MCFIFTSNEKNPMPLIATENIKVYKILYRVNVVDKIKILKRLGISNLIKIYKHYAPFYILFEYKKGKKTKKETLIPQILTESDDIRCIFIIQNGEYWYAIKEGYHSYKSSEITYKVQKQTLKYIDSDNFEVIEMTIPKGTKYYENEIEIVSECLKW